MIGERWSYMLMMVLAVLAAGTILRRQQRPLGLSFRQRFYITCFGLTGAVLAAKFPFVLSAGKSAEWHVWFADGKTVLWGLAGGYLGVELGKWSSRVTVRTGDTFVVAIATAIAIGRLGCFFYGCCYGVATTLPWGCRFINAPDHGTIARHPAQLYEVVFHFIMAVVFEVARRRGRLRGNLMPTYIALYATFRFVSEWWRPEPEWFAGLTFYQWSAMAIGLGFAVHLAWRAGIKESGS